jgi:hypothetical protein
MVSEEYQAYPGDQRRADTAASAIFGMWRDTRMLQTESSLIFGSNVTHDAMRVPNDDEVKQFLHGLVRGSLLLKPPLPPPPPSRWRVILDWITHPKVDK